MSLIVNAIGENPQQPGVIAETFIPDQLIAGNLQLVTEQIQLMSGSLARGAVLGQQTDDSIDVTAGSANVGNGAVGSVVVGVPAVYGAFLLTAKTAADFSVVDPEGNALPDATVGTAYAQAEIGFEINAGATPFQAGDTFTLNVIEATGNYVLSVKTATDGSQTPKAILVTGTDATSGPKTAGAYVLGEFNENAITFDPSWKVSALRSALRQFGIFLKSSVSAADPS
ncbi:head decoration protein [Paraburkholderia sp. BR14263]|uniref:head decoration protein n=1 Tax=unclassified Paraburkholderia TaxID=2615204 RepID=UPI0034CEFDD0